MPPTKIGRRGEASGTSRRVERVRRLLLRHGMPRALMSLILAATGAAGFLVSFALLHLGVARMWLRYPIAVLVAYGLFLLLLRVWLHLQRHSWTDLLPDDLNLSNVDSMADACAHVEERFSFGGAGDFGGGGAGGTWAEGVRGTPSSTSDIGTHASGGGVGGVGGGGKSGDIAGGILGGIDLDVDSEGCIFFLLALALIVAGVLASLYVVYAAPTLLAELLVEGILLSGLYRGMKKGARQGDWLRAVVRRTWLPVLLTLTLFAAAGYLLQRAAPRARSLGEAFKAVSSD
jgi:FtsH-binding integral membrane protein